MDPNHLISLQEATKYCDYSQEYLSLRARQGKLKAVKLNRDWLTRKEWIHDYLQHVRGYKKCQKPSRDIIKPVNSSQERLIAIMSQAASSFIDNLKHRK